MTTLPSITTSQLSRITGLDVRTLQRWHKKGIAPATVEIGTRRTFVLTYTEEQAYTVLVLDDFRRRKMKWRAVLKAAEQLGSVAACRYLIGHENGVDGLETEKTAISTMTALLGMGWAIDRADMLAKLGRDTISECKPKRS